VPQRALMEPLRRWDPEQVGGYVLLGRLGAGAMGQVYLGRSAAGRLVAIKTIKSELAEEPDFRTRFGQEVAAARRVSGAFTAAVVAADSEADVPWLATVYVPAPSLSRLVRSCGPLPVAAVRWLAAGCAEALEAIHSVGLVHRDLKPANVLVSPDGPRVIDFGVARAAERIQLTVTRGSVGTPAYMAPEQARDTRQATPASDVFSLGATALFAATGHGPYQGETVMDVLVRLATEPPDLSGLPAELAEIVTACLERDPRNRPTSASVVSRLAPGLAASGDLGSAPLPQAALELIEEYRETPSAADHALDDLPGEESTMGSQPLGASGEDPPAANARGHRAPRRPASAPPGRAARPGAGRDPATARPSRRALLTVAAAVLAGALIATGWAVGTSIADSHARQTLGPLTQPPGRPAARPAVAAHSSHRAVPTSA
jgi:serine/threonine protein kinase